jgi:N-acyl-D-aspartate/D-glutamate deacylase
VGSGTGATVIRNGQVHDGSGAPPRRADVLVRDGVVVEVRPGVAAPPGAQVVDARGCWVTPGFVDLHTHYEAELEMAPALTESVRHGVTTVLLGSCGLSFALGEPADLADMFCRVEGVPHSTVLPLLERIKDWETPAEYLDHLARLPLGPNVVAMLGHSALRARVMGLGRSVQKHTRPTPGELDHMARILDEALDAGYLGLSINTLPWDKMDGERYRSRPTPSVFATWAEYRHLARVLRRRDALFQAVPDLSTRLNLLLFHAASAGIGRATLRTMLISLVDPRSAPGLHRLVGGLAAATNRWLRTDVRYQSLPNPFDLWTDGLEVPVLEEIGAGTEALHVQDAAERSSLLQSAEWRRRFRRQWRNRLAGRAYHRDLDEATIVDAPDPALVGRSFAEVARQRGRDPIDTFLDLQAEHGNNLRWYTVVGNHRPQELEWIMAHPAVLVGFSDAGAHLRNMGYYNFPLRMLKRVRDAELARRPFMTVARAVHRLSGEIADHLGVDAGHLRPGARADVVVVDPEGLTDEVEQIHEAPMEGFDGLRRLVRRNDRAVRAVLVNGRLAWADGEPGTGLGSELGFGAVVRGAY